ncbi:MAG TPA: hypothetical protein VJ932_05175 [Alkalispirochaeta sp.]|nr:hypothetical protein [Alkalispirochaeta sp.]
MSSIPLSLRDELIRALRDTEEHTERIFMVLAERLPALVSEMKRSLARSQSAVADTAGDDANSGRTLQITSLLEETRGIMEESTHQFRAMSESDQALFEQLQTGIGQLHTIADSIGAIRMDSEDMELVSLNAMTVALKAGSAGRAFSYITDELKRLANRTIVLAESISGRGHALLEAFQELEQTLDDARQFQTTLIESFQSRIFSTFDDFSSAVRETMNGLRRLHEESYQLQDPVNGMMEAIQLQDLIRQSIDHIILALEAIQPEDELTDDDDVLDELAFVRRIPDLAVSLIEDVAQQIDNSVETFSQLIQDAESKRSRLEENREQFIQGQTSTGEQTLNERFDEAAELLKELLSDLDRNLQKKELLVSRSTQITKDVEQLEDQFRSFDTLVTRFHSIDIASRIEVAKQDVLRSMGNTSDQMNNLTKQIERDVDESLTTTQDFIKTTSSVIATHQKNFHEQRLFVERFTESIRRRYDALQESRSEITHSVEGFSLFTEGFHRVFEESKESGKQLSTLSHALRGLETQLHTMRDAIDSQYHEKLKSRGLGSWTIENDRLQNIIQRFTIFAHKQQASELAGLEEVDDSVEAGDVTLF